jgi:tetratricopeptide (TPR) repeat protein
MRNLLYLLFISISNLYIAQNFDSLVYCSVRMSHDSERVNLFYREGFSARLHAPQFAYECAKQAEYFALRSKSIFHQAKANNLLGILYYRKGDLKKAFDYHSRALELREGINDEQGIAFSETNLGNIYSDMGKFSLAEQSYLRALQLNSKLGNEKQSGNCYVNLGVLKTNLNLTDEAERYFYNAFKIAKNTIDYELEALCLNNLAQINIIRKEYEAAISNCMDALKVKEIMGNDIEKADSYINLAKAYFHLNHKQQSEEYLNKADSICSLYDYPEAKLELYNLKAFIYESNQQYAQALQSFKSYISLKDSLAELNKQLQAASTFNDNMQPSVNKHIHFSFPYFMLLCLTGICISCIYFIYSNKR